MLYPYTIYGFGGGFIMYLIQVIYKGYRGEEEEKKNVKRKPHYRIYRKENDKSPSRQVSNRKQFVQLYLLKFVRSFNLLKEI